MKMQVRAQQYSKYTDIERNIQILDLSLWKAWQYLQHHWKRETIWQVHGVHYYN